MPKYTFEVGQEVLFTGYTQLDAGMEEKLTAGAHYKIESINDDGGIVVRDRDGSGDTVFDDEIAPLETKRKTTAGAKKKAPAKTPAKTPAKAPAKKGGNKKTKAQDESGDGTNEPEAKVIAPVVTESVVHPPLTDSKSVADILQSKDMLTAAKELAVAAEETFISLGGVLSHIYDNGAHLTLGYDGKRGFADYMLNELNIQYRKGMYLIQIYKLARQYDLDERLLAEIGWSKMKEIASTLDASNADELLEYAREHTREDLVDHVRRTYVKAGEATDDPGRVLKTRLTFNLFGDQTQVVERALTAAQGQLDAPTPEKGLMLICSEWSQFTEQVELSVDQAVNALAERFGLENVQAALDSLNEKNDEEVVELVEA